MKKILLYDLETSPSLGYVWGKYEQDVIEFEQDWYILSFAYRWLDGTTKVVALPDFASYKRNPENDKELVKKLWELFNEADITVAHNNLGFDSKKANARFIQHGLTPPKPYKAVDTLAVARKHFKFTSNKLDDLGKDLGVGRKLETGGYALWRECLRGNLKAWRKMKQYNKQDVELLLKVYEKLLPWMSGLITTNTYGACPKCGVEKLQARGFSFSVGRKYRRYQCLSCGGWSSDRRGEKVEKPLTSL